METVRQVRNRSSTASKPAESILTARSDAGAITPLAGFGQFPFTNITEYPMFQKMIKAAALSAAFALAAAHPAYAASFSYTETGDAGDLVTGAAQAVTGNAGDTVAAIKGSLGLTAGISEADAFKIYISAPSAFSASTTGFVPGSNSFDSELFLFGLDGKGIVMNDDDSVSGGSQSAILAGNSFTASLTPGYYYLLITGSSKNPSSAGGLIFPNTTDFSVDPTGIYGPTGAGGASAISGFSGSSNEGGAYSIALTGVTIAAVAVPEPSTLCLGLAGGLMLFGLSRRRQGKTAAQ
jgi:hypothetical protein